MCWGSDYWFRNLCVGAMTTGLVLCVVGQCSLVWYCVWWESDYWFGIVWGGAVINSLVLCVVGQ